MGKKRKRITTGVRRSWSWRNYGHAHKIGEQNPFIKIMTAYRFPSVICHLLWIPCYQRQSRGIVKSFCTTQARRVCQIHMSLQRNGVPPKHLAWPDLRWHLPLLDRHAFKSTPECPSKEHLSENSPWLRHFVLRRQKKTQQTMKNETKWYGPQFYCLLFTSVATCITAEM